MSGQQRVYRWTGRGEALTASLMIDLRSIEGKLSELVVTPMDASRLGSFLLHYAQTEGIPVKR